MNYVYISSEPGLWTVGFYDPKGKFQPDSDHASKDGAAERVSYLNGKAAVGQVIREESARHLETIKLALQSYHAAPAAVGQRAPRKPTSKEADLLAKAYAQRWNDDEDNGADVLSSAWTAIFDGYITDSPGYRGKVAVVVYSGGPEIIGSFTFHNIDRPEEYAEATEG